MFAQGLTFTKTSCHFWLLCETQNNLVAGRQTDSWPTFTKSGIDFVYTHMESQIGWDNNSTTIIERNKSTKTHSPLVSKSARPYCNCCKGDNIHYTEQQPTNQQQKGITTQKPNWLIKLGGSKSAMKNRLPSWYYLYLGCYSLGLLYHIWSIWSARGCWFAHNTHIQSCIASLGRLSFVPWASFFLLFFVFLFVVRVEWGQPWLQRRRRQRPQVLRCSYSSAFEFGPLIFRCHLRAGNRERESLVSVFPQLRLKRMSQRWSACQCSIRCGPRVALGVCSRASLATQSRSSTERASRISSPCARNAIRPIPTPLGAASPRKSLCTSRSSPSKPCRELLHDLDLSLKKALPVVVV